MSMFLFCPRTVDMRVLWTNIGLIRKQLRKIRRSIPFFLYFQRLFDERL